MRVTCSSVPDFLVNLEDGLRVLKKTIWLNRERKEIGECKFLVSLQASAVVGLESGGEFLLQYGEECGLDFTDGDGQTDGSNIAGIRTKRVHEFCGEHGLKVKPGVVDF